MQGKSANESAPHTRRGMRRCVSISLVALCFTITVRRQARDRVPLIRDLFPVDTCFYKKSTYARETRSKPTQAQIENDGAVAKPSNGV